MPPTSYCRGDIPQVRTHTHTHIHVASGGLQSFPLRQRVNFRNPGQWEGVTEGAGSGAGPRTVVSDAASALGMEGSWGGAAGRRERAESAAERGRGAFRSAEAVLGSVLVQGDLASPGLVTEEALSFSRPISSSVNCRVRALGSMEPCKEWAKPGPVTALAPQDREAWGRRGCILLGVHVLIHERG